MWQISTEMKIYFSLLLMLVILNISQKNMVIAFIIHSNENTFSFKLQLTHCTSVYYECNKYS